MNQTARADPAVLSAWYIKFHPFLRTLNEVVVIMNEYCIGIKKGWIYSDNYALGVGQMSDNLKEKNIFLRCWTATSHQTD